MALSELEVRRISKVVGAFVEARRPAPHIRPELDLAFRISGQRVEIFEIRPVWQGAPGETMDIAVAKATYVRRLDLWRVYWMRGDLKWHPYPPAPQVGTIEKFLVQVERDEYACFFG